MTPEDMAAQMGAEVADIATMTPGEAMAYALGGVHGYRAGRADLNAEIDAAIAERSVALVRNLAKVPARDHAADAERAARRDAWWSQRRGEVAA